MAQADPWHCLHDIAAGQFGLFTAAQARRHGIPGYQLARHVNHGNLVRVRHGVYRCTTSAPAHPFETWAAHWLALRPTADIAARRAAPDSMISHHSAAVIRGLGALDTAVLHLTTVNRIRPNSDRVRTSWRPLGTCGADWGIVAGLPVATAGRIVADLARPPGHDGVLGAVIADALRTGAVTVDELAARLHPFAPRWKEHSGQALAQRFVTAAGHPRPQAPHGAPPAAHRIRTPRDRGHQSRTTPEHAPAGPP